MESPTDNDQLLDLLYGELPPEEEEQLRRAIREDEQLADQWRQLQRTHDEVSQHVPEPEDVPEGVQQAILQKARRGDATDVDRGGGNASRRARGVWSRLAKSGQARGLVAAAVMLISGAVVALIALDTGVLAPDNSEVVSAVAVQQDAASSAPGKPAAAQEIEQQSEERKQIEQAGQKARQLAESKGQHSRRIADNIEDVEEDSDDEHAEQQEVIAGRIDDTDQMIGRGAIGRGAGGAASQSSDDRVARAAEPESEPEPQAAPRARRAADESSAAPQQVALDQVEQEDSGDVIALGDSLESPPSEEVADDEFSDDPAELADQARQAFDDGDREEARRLLRQLFDSDGIDELDEDRRRDVDRLRRAFEGERGGE